MNTNLIHNIINTAMVAIPALEVFNWSAFFTPDEALQIVGALGLLKIAINVWRDGVTGLAKQQPPVQ